MKKKNTEDTILIQNILEGDKQSEEKLYEKYKKILTDYLRKEFPRNSEYEDDVSEILIKVFLSLSNYDLEKSKFKTWVFTIAKNYMIDKSRCTWKLTNNNNTNDYYFYDADSITLQNASLTMSSDTTTYTSDGSTHIYTSNNCDFIEFENTVSVNYVSNQLKSCDFTFLNMHYGYGYSYCEIGNEFNVSSNTVSNRVNYIKNKLKKCNNKEIIY